MSRSALAGGRTVPARVTAPLALALALAVWSPPAGTAGNWPPPVSPAGLGAGGAYVQTRIYSMCCLPSPAFSFVPPTAPPSPVVSHHVATWSIDRSAACLCGFLDLNFIHPVVIPNEEYRRLADMVSADTLGACIRHLENYGTRHSSSQGVLHAGRWLAKRLVGYGYPDTLLQEIRRDGKVVLAPRNVIATKYGVSKPQYRIVIGGHYDSITYGQPVPAVEVAPGADDDASGVAGTMEIARILADVDLDATVQFVLFAGHEQGLYGSLEFVRSLIEEGTPKDKLFFINLDMIGNADTSPWKVRIYTDDNSLPLAQLLEGTFDTYTSVEPVLAGNRLADQTSFQQQGYPAIFVHEADFSLHYHSIEDRFVYLEMDYEAQIVRAVLAMVLHLALITDPPTGVTAFQTADGDLRVEWEHPPDPDVLRYHVELLDQDGRLLGRRSTSDNYLTLDDETAAGVSRLRIRAEDVIGESEPSEPLFVGGGRFIVQGVSPNPARHECNFDIFVPGAGDLGRASLTIFDASGRLVRSLHLSRGAQSLCWDTTASDGRAVPSGVYFYLADVDGIGKHGGKIMVVR
jgi:hypothetical protein